MFILWLKICKNVQKTRYTHIIGLKCGNLRVHGKNEVLNIININRVGKIITGFLIASLLNLMAIYENIFL